MERDRASLIPIPQICLLGPHKAGKTSIMRRKNGYTFDASLKSTYGIDYKMSFQTIDGQTVNFQIVAGQEKFFSVSTSYIKKCQGVALVFDVTDRFNFETLGLFYQEIENNGSNLVARVLVANKIDLQDERLIDREEGQVRHTSDQAFAKKHQLRYVECSAKTGEGVDQIFVSLLKDIQLMGGASKDKDISVFSDSKGLRSAEKDQEKRPTLRGEDLHASTIGKKKKQGCC